MSVSPRRIEPLTTAPLVRSCIRLMARKSVVLPEPDGPMSEVTLFLGTSKRRPGSRSGRGRSPTRLRIASRSGPTGVPFLVRAPVDTLTMVLGSRPLPPLSLEPCRKQAAAQIHDQDNEHEEQGDPPGGFPQGHVRRRRRLEDLEAATRPSPSSGSTDHVGSADHPQDRGGLPDGPRERQQDCGDEAGDRRRDDHLSGYDARRAPSARPASRIVFGTPRSAVSEAFMITGIMRTPMAKLPATPGEPDSRQLDAPLVEADDDHLVGEDAEQDRGKTRS